MTRKSVRITKTNVIENVPIRVRRSKARNVKAQGSNDAKAIVKSMVSVGPITADGAGFLHHSLNPCGDHTGYSSARCPDGALSQSGVLSFRLFDMEVAPFQSLTAVADTTKNWSLILLSPALYGTFMVLIACPDALVPNTVELESILLQFNEGSAAEFPAWSEISAGGRQFYVTIQRYTAANLDYNSMTQQSNAIESFRVVGDGYVVQHNSPKIWDQGGFATGQFQTDFELVNGSSVRVDIIISGNLTSPINGPVLTNFRITAVAGSTSTILADHPGALTLSTTTDTLVPGVVLPQGSYTIKKPDGQDLCRDITTPYDWRIVAVSPDSLMISTAGTTGGPFVFFTSRATAFRNTECYSPSQVLGANEDMASVLIDVPSFDWPSLAQNDPHYGGEAMQAHGGFYVVRRYFQPVLSMQPSNFSGNVKFIFGSMDRKAATTSPGGIGEELVDKNGAFIVSIIKGISYAAIPIIKGNRYIEFLPSANSILGPLVNETPDMDPDAITIFREVQSKHPHSYIPDANHLGLLGRFINNVVAGLPLYLRTGRSIADAVSRSIRWVQDKLGLAEEMGMENPKQN